VGVQVPPPAPCLVPVPLEKINVFDELQRALRQMERQTTISIPMPSDAEGYFDRKCPADECLFQFKVHRDDWREKVRDDEVFCPFCGHSASDKWWTQEQIAHAKEAALANIKQQLGTAMKRDAENWNRRQPPNTFLRSP
jgi:hypothetical protein